jgi:hypothetical protein
MPTSMAMGAPASRAALPPTSQNDGDRSGLSWFARQFCTQCASVNGCQNPRTDGAAKKVGMAFALTSAAPCRRNLGGKRGLGGKPCQGLQPPEAGAGGPPLQGLPPSHTRPPRSTADHHDAASFAIFGRIHAAGNTPPPSAWRRPARRHPNNCCGVNPCRRATAETVSPLAQVSATIMLKTIMLKTCFRKI